MAEDERAVAAIHGFAEEFQQSVDFRRGRLGFPVQKSQVATRLSQPEEGCENLHASSSARLAHGIDFGAGGDLELRVGGLLFGAKLHLHDLFDFGREFLEDFRLRAAKHPGSHASEQSRPDSSGFPGGQRFFVAVLKILSRAEIARQQEVEERPEVSDGVLQRGSGEDESSLRTDGTRRPRILAPGIFDVLGLIECGRRKDECFVMLGVTAQEGVAGDDQVVLRNLGELF